MNQTTITITCKHGTSLDDESSSTCWRGRLPKGCTDPAKRKDLHLNEPLPEIPAEAIAHLPPSSIAAVLNDAFAALVRRTKCQRLGFGDSYSLNLSRDVLELGNFILVALTEGTRTKAVLSGARIRELINSDEFKTAAAERISATSIKPEAFKQVVIDEFLRCSTREEFVIYTSRAAVAQKAIAHLEAIAQALHSEQHRATLNAAISVLRAAPIVADEEGI